MGGLPTLTLAMVTTDQVGGTNEPQGHTRKPGIYHLPLVNGGIAVLTKVRSKSQANIIPAITQFRNNLCAWALENGRSMVRATNNGVTAFINHRGELTGTLPQFEVGVLQGEPELRTGLTPFHRFGSLPILGLCAMTVLLMFGFRALKERVRLGSPFR
jgi:apolipoprotein N-acyltransferase